MNKLFVASVAAMTIGMTTAQGETIPADMNITAHEWCQHVVAGWNLGNSFEGCAVDWNDATWTWDDGKSYTERLDWETSWVPHKTTKADIDAVAAAGFNAVRIPVRWEPHVRDHQTMEIDPAWINRVKEVVDWCLDNDMYVLINTHHEKWLESNPYYSQQSKVNDMLSKLWTNIATAFADYDGRLAFAGTNEVHKPDEWGSPGRQEYLDVLNSFHRTFVQAVRATGGKNRYRNLVVQTYVCSPEAGVTVPADVDGVSDRLSVEFHYYQPWDYCGLGAYYYWSNVSEIERIMNFAQNAWWSKGYGVIVGEYGVVRHFDSSATPEVQDQQLKNNAYYNRVICSAMRDRGFAGFVWDNNMFGNGEDQFGIFNRDEGMRVDNKYAYAGIAAGSGIAETNVTDLPEVPELTGGSVNVEDLDPYTGPGTVIWNGKGTLNWGNGLQLSLDSYNFTNLKDGAKIELYYTNTGAGVVELWDQTWDSSNHLSLTDDHGQKGFQFTLPAGHCLSLTISSASLAILKQKGLVIQGMDAVLQRVVLIDGDGEISDGNGGISDDEDPQPATTSPADWYSNMAGDNAAWKGQKVIQWSDGLYVDRSNFAPLPANTEANQVVIYYEITNPNESMIKFCYDDRGWQAIAMKQGSTQSEVFHLVPNTQAQAGMNILVVNIPKESLSLLKSHNMVLHGTGVTLKQVLVVNADQLNQLQIGDVNADRRVSVVDVVRLVEYQNMSQKVDWLICTKTADVDHQKGIDADDITSLVDAILEK